LDKSPEICSFFCKRSSSAFFDKLLFSRSISFIIFLIKLSQIEAKETSLRVNVIFPLVSLFLFVLFSPRREKQIFDYF